KEYGLSMVDFSSSSRYKQMLRKGAEHSMVYKIKSPAKKQLKEPDEFITLFSRVLLYARRHTKQLSIVLGAAVLAAAIIGILFAFESRANRQAQVLGIEAL